MAVEQSGLVSDALPAGTVTLLLADIEGSTRLWEERRDEMVAAIAQLDATLDDVVPRWGGVRPVEQGEGDSFVAAFTSASNAISCAIDLQRATRRGVLRLRMGIHTGEVQLRDAANYVGPTINRTARIRDAGHGGQVLLSRTVADLVSDRLPTGATILDLGHHRLKDLGRPEHIFQLRHPDVVNEHPPLRALDVVRNNLPQQLTSFVGRATELAAVHALLDDARAVTLTGSGGCGKTRLGVHVAADRLDAYPGGVWFVDLATVKDETGVATAAAEALGLVVHTAPALDTVARAVGHDPVLIVLDNCEHVIGASAELVDALLRRCAGLVVMATSREPLGVTGEVTFRVPSLPFPARGTSWAAEEVARFEAVELFVERAWRAKPEFALDEDNADAVVEICGRLDGIPLVLELAAARLRVLTPAQIRDGLHDRFRLLTGGARTAVPRQQALQASVDWSYALLLDAERTVLNRLSVFVGGFTLDAAEVVCAGGLLEPHHVFDLITQLVDKSLVVPEGEGRFTLLETVRSYAAARLVEGDDVGAVRRRHYEVCLRLSNRHARSDSEYRRSVAADYENVRRALEWAADQDDPALLGRLTARLYLYWTTGTRMRDGTTWFGRLVDRTADPSARAKTLTRYALLAFLAGDVDVSAPAAREAVALTRELGDPRALAWTLLSLAQGLAIGDEQAAVVDEALRLATELGDDEARAWALYLVGWHEHQTDPAASVEPLEESVALARAGGYAWIERLSSTVLAFLPFTMGEVRDARAPLEAAVAALRDADEGSLAGSAAAYAAIVHELLGDGGAADGALREIDAFADDVGAVGARMRRDFAHAVVSMLRGEFDGATAVMNRCLELPLEPHFMSSVLTLRSFVHGLAGRADDAATDAAAAARLVLPGVGDSAVGTPSLGHAVAARAAGDLARAESLAHTAIAEVHARSMAAYVRIASVGVLASVLARTGRADDAIRLFGAVAAHVDRVGMVADSAFLRAVADGQDVMLREAVDADRFERLWSEGAGLAWGEAVAFAERGRGDRKRPRIGWASLTPTERQVVDLVATGASNGEVAERLFMSIATVKSHLTHVYGKLGISSRGRLTAEAIRQTTTEV